MNDKIDEVLDERGKRYGRFSDHARISQALKRAMHDSPNWERLTDYQKEGLEMIQHKVARMLNGDPSYVDNVVDIAGYSTLVMDIMEKSNVISKEMEK